MSLVLKIKPLIVLDRICMIMFSLFMFIIDLLHISKLVMESLKGLFLDTFCLMFTCYLLISLESITSVSIIMWSIQSHMSTKAVAASTG